MAYGHASSQFEFRPPFVTFWLRFNKSPAILFLKKQSDDVQRFQCASYPPFYGLLIHVFGIMQAHRRAFWSTDWPAPSHSATYPHGLRTFGFFIAISQVMAGALVLSQRYSVLGLIMLIPMNLGILLVTISQNWAGTPYVDAVFTTLNIFALLYEWNTLKFLLFPEQSSIQLPLRVNQLFPGTKFPLLIIGIFGISCVLSRYQILATSGLATLAYALTFITFSKVSGFHSYIVPYSFWLLFPF